MDVRTPYFVVVGLCLALLPVDRVCAEDILDAPPVTVDTAHDPMPFVPGSWTMVVMPDTQNYINTRRPDLLPGIFTQMCDWIVANKEARNIGLVVFEGDIVNNNDLEHKGTPAYEWTLAKRAIGVLDGEVPYVLVTGNHDYGPRGSANDRETMLNSFFHAADNSLNDPAKGGIIAGVFDPGRLDNTYSLVDTGTRKLLVFSLEFGPRQRVVDWANIVAAQPQFSGHSLVLVTHAYLREGNLPDPQAPISERNLPRAYRADFNDAKQNNKHNPHNYKLASIDADTDPVHDGEELWRAFVSRHANFKLVLNGHYGSGNDAAANPSGQPAHPLYDDGGASTARQTSIGIHGNPVHEIVANYQFSKFGGNGHLRLMEFLPDGRTVHVKTFSPFAATRGDGAWLTDPRHQFTLTLPDDSANDETQQPYSGVPSSAPNSVTHTGP
jgi:hypothetical protein